MPKQLLEDDTRSVPDSTTSLEWKINESFAKAYEEKKRREELSQLEEKYKGNVKSVREQNDSKSTKSHNEPRAGADTAGDEEIDDDDYDSDEDSEEDEDEDELADLLTPEVDAQILKTISTIRAGDSRIYDSSMEFFSEELMKRIRTEWKLKQQGQLIKGEKPLTLREYKQQLLLTGRHEGFESDEDLPLPTHVEEQHALKQEAIIGFAARDDVDQEDEDFLKKKVSNIDQGKQEKEADEYRQFLLQNLEAEDSSKKTMTEWLAHKRSKRETPKPASEVQEGESFLASYILSRGWLNKVDKKNARVVFSQEIDEEDEEHVDKAEELETIYNFRFEPEGLTKLATHGRSIEGSVRREDDTRKRKRKARQERKALEKQKEMEELKRLKNLKKQELLSKLERIEKIAGEGVMQVLDVDDLDEDYDPDKFNEKMERIFNEDYYREKDDQEQFLHENDGIMEELLGKPAGEVKKTTEVTSNSHLPLNQQEEVNELTKASSKRTSHGSPLSDDMLEEYYKLHYEDKLEGLKTRFKYSSTMPATYGLSIKDILEAEDARLNRHVSLKKLAPYIPEDEQRHDIQKYGTKRRVQKFFLRPLDAIVEQEKEKKAKKNKANKVLVAGS